MEGRGQMIELKMTHMAAEQIRIQCSMKGGTDDLLDELASGMAYAILQIADDLPAQDELHESLARVLASRMIAQVHQALAQRASRDEPPEA